MASYEDQIKKRDEARMNRAGMTEYQKQINQRAVSQANAAYQNQQNPPLRPSSLVTNNPKTTKKLDSPALPSLPQNIARPPSQPQTRAIPTEGPEVVPMRQDPMTATQDNPIVTRGQLPAGAAQDEKAMLENIALKNYKGETLSDDEVKFQFNRLSQQPTLDQFMQMTPEQLEVAKAQAGYEGAQMGANLQMDALNQQGQVLDDRLARQQQDIEQAREDMTGENNDLLNQFKDLRREQDKISEQRIIEAGQDSNEQLMRMAARRGATRSSRTAEELRKAGQATQDAVRQIELATGQAVSDYQVKLLDRMEQKISKLEDRYNSTLDAKDEFELGRAQQEAQLTMDLWSADPNNPTNMVELAGRIQTIKLERNEQLQEAAQSKFEKGLEYGYVPQFSQEEAGVLAHNFGVSEGDLPSLISDMMMKANYEKMAEKIEYQTDNEGNVTALMFNTQTGGFDQIDLGQIGKGVESRFQISNNPVTGETMIFDPSTGKIIGKQDAFGNFTGTGTSYYPPGSGGYASYAAAGDDALASIFPVGQEVGWCGVYASTLSDAGPVGDYWSDKRKKITHNSNPTPGDKLLVPLGVKSDGSGYGHVAVVIDYDPNTGEVKVVESNKDGRQNRGEGPGKVSIGTYNVNALQSQYGTDWGFMKGNFRPNVQKKLDALAIPTQPVATGGDLMTQAQQEAARRYPDDIKKQSAFVQTVQRTGVIPEDKEGQKESFDQSQALASRYKPLQDEVRTLEQGFAVTRGFDVNTTNPYDDQALIFSFMKVLDPGSVVREGEFNTAQNNASLLESFSANWKKAATGTGMLEPAQRQKILDTMNNLYSTKRGSYDQELEVARGVGQEYGIDPSLYLTVPEGSQGTINSGNTSIGSEINQALSAGYPAEQVLQYYSSNPQYSGFIQKAQEQGVSPEKILQYLQSR